MAILEIRTSERQKSKSFGQFLVHNSSLCASKLRFLSMIKPSNLWCNIWLIFVALWCGCELAVSTQSLCCNLFLVTSNALVFLVLMYNLVFSWPFFNILQIIRKSLSSISDIVPVCTQEQGGIISIYINGGVVQM